MTMCRAMTYTGSVTVVAAALAFLSFSAAAADIERGRQFARRVCSVCHQVSPGSAAGVPPAPPFELVAKSAKFRAKRAKLLWEAHGVMPNFALTADEADDVAAYIASLARKRPARD